MRRLCFFFISCLVSYSLAMAQKRWIDEQGSGLRITQTYNNESLSEILRELSQHSGDYTIFFLYNELEDFRITTTIKNKQLPDAIRQMITFYPIRMVVKSEEKEIFVECTYKTDRRLTGTIIDEQGRPLAYANVALLSPKDSTLLSGGVTNESGYFAIPYDSDRILARISYVGCKTIYKECEQAEAGIIRMWPETQRLDGIMVKGQVPIMRQQSGTIIYDTRHIVGAINATDLLRYAPGVIVDEDKISLLGTSGVVFHIDGKEQRMGTKEFLLLLNSFSASEVERIEITQSPGASLSAVDHTGLINIVLKKHGNDYLGLSAGYARTQYEEHGDEANASIIYNRGKVSTSLNLSGIWNHDINSETNNVHFTDNLRQYTDKKRISKDNYSLRWQMDYKASDKLNLGTYVMYADGKRHLGMDGLYDFLQKKPFSVSSIDTRTLRQEDTKSWAMNLYAEQKLGEGHAEIDYNLDYYRMKLGDTRHSVSDNTLIGNSINDFHRSDTIDFDYQNQISLTVDNYSAKVDVCYGGFRLGSQYAYTRSQQNLDYSGVKSNTPYEHVSATYDEQILAGYVEYMRKYGNAWSLNLGGRYEHTWTKGKNMPMADGTQTDYGKLFPSLHVGYNPNLSHTFHLSLCNRITRPNFINLNPNWVWQDVNHISFGNQRLKPSYLYKAIMGYTYKGVLSFDLYYAYQPNRVDAIYHVENQRTVNSWDNITDEYDFGINSIWCFDQLSWMTATLLQGVSYVRTVRPEKEIGQGIVRHYLYSKVRNISYTCTLQASFFFDHERKWIANLNATYHSQEKNVARALKSRYMVDVGLQHQFWKDRLTLGLSCRNLFASRLKGTEYLGTTTMDFDNKFNYRQLRLTLTYNWGARLRHDRCHYESDEMQKRIVNDF